MTSSKSERKNEAYDRNKYWASLSPQDQLQSLNNRLGEDLGAIKQRKKIQSLINNPKKEKQLKKVVKNAKKNQGL
tara:strand:- start:871 stop:1095 length:225 start_codon:yes stop_codon:yes gene_type:complete